MIIASYQSSVLLARGRITLPPAYMEPIVTSLHIYGAAPSTNSISKSACYNNPESTLIALHTQNYLVNTISMRVHLPLLEQKLSSSNHEQTEQPHILTTEKMDGILALVWTNFETSKYM